MGAKILTEVFSIAGSVVTGLGTLFTAIFGLIYDSTGGGALTELGTIIVLVVAAPLAYMVLAWVISLFRKVKVFGGAKK